MKINDYHYYDKYIITQEVNKLTAENFTARLAQVYLASENDIANFINFTPTLVDHHLLLDINFNGHCLIKHNISIPKKLINL